MKRRRGIFRSMLCGVSVLIIATVVSFDALVMFNAWRNEQQASQQAAQALSQKIQNAVRSYVKQMDATISSVYYDLLSGTEGGVYKLLSARDYQSNAERVSVNRYLNDFFSKIYLMQPELASAYIYVGDEKNFYWPNYERPMRGYSPVGSDWFVRTLALDGRTLARINYISEGRTYQKPVIGFSRRLKNLSSTGVSEQTVILIEFSISAIEELISNYITDESTQVLLVGADGAVLYRLGEGFVPESLKDTGLDLTERGSTVVKIGDHTVCLSRCGQQIQDWYVIILTDYWDFLRSFENYLLSSAVLAAIMICLAMIPAYVYVRKLSREVGKLEVGMLKLCGGDFSVRLSTKRRDELGSLVGSFNTMAQKTQALIRQQYEQELEKREAQYKYLQAQIDPHFIFNSLQIISSMAIVHGIAGIESVSNSLARLLSYSLAGDSKVITIDEELKNVDQYMVIQKERFRGRLTCSVDVDAEVRKCDIIKMVLQPIVENALTHGFDPNGGAGAVLIHGFRQAGDCVLLVCDNGCGMSAEQAALLNRFINGDPDAHMDVKGHGVGLKNINNRLKLYYGEPFGLRIESEPGTGTTVVIRIPVDKGASA